MFVRYATDLMGDIYHIWNPKTNGYHVPLDVIWLKRMFFTKPDVIYDMAVPPLEITGINPSMESGENERGKNESSGENIDLEDDSDNLKDDTSKNEDTEEEDQSEDEDKQPRATRSGRTIREPARLIEELGATMIDYEIKLIAVEDHYYETMR
jgi:hypothetical protein